MSRSVTRSNRTAHEQKLFQQTIFWPTLESIHAGRRMLIKLDEEELSLTERPLADRSMAGMDHLLERQRALAARRAELQAELERKWVLVHAGCHWMAVQMADSDGLSEILKPSPSPSPDTVRRVLVDGAPLYYESCEVN